MKEAPPFFRPLDGVLLLLLLALAGGSLILLPGNERVEGVSVFVDGRWVRSLPAGGEEGEQVLRGALGNCRFTFDGKGCQMLSAPCPNKHCIRQGRVTGAGRAVVCLPNRVALVLQGASEDGIDGVTR